MNFLLNWFDIPATDIDRAVKFYNDVFNFNLKVIDCGEEKMACFPKINGISGALSQSSGFKPSPDGIQITFDGGNNLNEALNRIKRAGGTIVRGKTNIEADGRGYFAQFLDSEGNTLGLYSDN